jgi:outer membrane scaffolding protein for murein synthesis (MipA/OmpV family)
LIIDFSRRNARTHKLYEDKTRHDREDIPGWAQGGKVQKRRWAIFNGWVPVLLTFLFIIPGVSQGSDTWAFKAGGGVFRENVYSGSNDQYFTPAPIIEATYTAGSLQFSASIPDGIGLAWFDTQKGLMGRLNVNYGEIRDSEEYSVLGVMKDHSQRTKIFLADTPTADAPVVYDATFGFRALKGMAGASVSYYPTSLDYQLAGQEDRDYNGILYTAFYSYDRAVTQRHFLSAMVGLQYMNDDYADAWYTVRFPTAELDGFEADAGLRDVMLSVQATSMLSEKVGISYLGAFTRLLGDAGQSPYTLEKFQPSTLLYGFYNF